MSDKIYIVWQGEYSSRRIVIVFREKEQAETFVRNACAQVEDGENRPDYEEVEIAELVPTAYFWACWMDIDGKVTSLQQKNITLEKESPHFQNSRYNGFVFWACGETKEHAVKNAADFRRSWLANNLHEHAAKPANNDTA